MTTSGKFVISLDFELLWGVRDKLSTEAYGQNLLGVWEALPKTIEAFEAHRVKATFATVGFLLASDKEELIHFSPEKKPSYLNKNVSPYNGHLDLIDDTEESGKYHFAPSLIELIKKYPDQELATHTFSHYYCLESGQTKENFEDDLIAAIKISEAKGISIKSIIFPRNQFNREYLQILTDLGITSYRGNEKVWFFNGKMGESDKLSKRALRLLDTYINISGHNCYDLEEIKKSVPYNIPSSRFLRPYSPTLKFIESFRLKRILNGMTYAAKNNKVYHLWWHPHNFGIHQEENFNMLNKLLDHYTFLNAEYGFESLTMGEISDALTHEA